MRNSTRFSRFTLVVWLFMAFVLLAADLAGAAGTVEEFNKGKEGQEINVASLPSQGNITVVDFTSEFCPPCRRWGMLLQELAKKRTDLAIRKLDVNRPGVMGIDWRSPLVQQFQLRGLPHFKIFGKNGELMAEGESAVNMLVDWCKQASVLKE
jgi:thiol-disulfide isomerase/thioredoxin